MNWDQLQNILNRLLQPLKNKISLMIGRAILTAINDGGGIQQVQVSILAGESMDKVARMQNFGFTSVPPKGSEGIILALQGNRENLVVVAADHRDFRVKGLAEGESAQYNKTGAKTVLKASNNMETTGIAKLKFANGSQELITVLSTLIQAIIDARTDTAIGPMPLINIADPFTAIKARLDTFKI